MLPTAIRSSGCNAQLKYGNKLTVAVREVARRFVTLSLPPRSPLASQGGHSGLLMIRYEHREQLDQVSTSLQMSNNSGHRPSGDRGRSALPGANSLDGGGGLICLCQPEPREGYSTADLLMPNKQSTISKNE